MRTPRRMRGSGIARRKLIRSRSVAATAASGTERRRSRRPQLMVAGRARAPVTHFESALAAPPRQHPGSIDHQSLTTAPSQALVPAARHGTGLPGWATVGVPRASFPA
jgi:hypothetical protein